MYRKLPFLSITFLAIALLLTLSLPRKALPAYAATASHIVISEVQVGATVSTDEFVELYNPTNSNVDVTGWRLSKKTAGGTESDLVTDFPAKTINAHGFLLIAHTDYDDTPAEDITYSTAFSIANDNTVLLYNASDTVVDRVGLGTAGEFEGAAKTNPSSGDSVERKASSTSDATSLGVGGTEETAGNGEDTDNNSSDFVNRGTPQPQNTASALEPTGITPTLTPTGGPSGTNTPTPTGTVSPTGSPSVTPTVTNAPTHTPTLTPTVTHTVTPTQTPTTTVSPTNSPTLTPSQTPTNTPTPTVSSTGTPTPTTQATVTNTPTHTPTPTITPSGGVTLGTFIFPHKTIVCKVDVRVRMTRRFTLFIPVFTCSEV